MELAEKFKKILIVLFCSEWQPSLVHTWLGFVIDLGSGQIKVPQVKIIALYTQIKEVTLHKVATDRYIASKVISMFIHSTWTSS